MDYVGVEDAQLKTLRESYVAFSTDQTRVSSMRVMAAQIADELLNLINYRPLPANTLGEYNAKK